MILTKLRNFKKVTLEIIQSDGGNSYREYVVSYDLTKKTGDIVIRSWRYEGFTRIEDSYKEYTVESLNDMYAGQEFHFFIRQVHNFLKIETPSYLEFTCSEIENELKKYLSSSVESKIFKLNKVIVF